MESFSRFFFISMLASLPTLTGWAGGGHGGGHVPEGSTAVAEESCILVNQTGSFYLSIEKVNGRLTTIDTQGVFGPGESIPFSRNLDKGWINITLGVYDSSNINPSNYVGIIDLTIDAKEGAGTINSSLGLSGVQFNPQNTNFNVYGLGIGGLEGSVTGTNRGRRFTSRGSGSVDYSVILKNGSTEYTYYAIQVDPTTGRYPQIAPGEELSMQYLSSTSNQYPSFDIGLSASPSAYPDAADNANAYRNDSANVRGNWGINLALGTGISVNDLFTNDANNFNGTSTASITSSNNTYTLVFDDDNSFPSPYASQYWVYDPSENHPSFPNSLTDYGTVVPYRGVNLSGGEFASACQIPDVRSATYYADKGVNTIRLPFAWEYLQAATPLGVDIDFANGRAKTYLDTVQQLTDKGFTVIVDMHNYMRFNGVGQMPKGQGGSYTIGGTNGGPTAAQYGTAWASIAKAVEDIDTDLVIFDLMNEPMSGNPNLSPATLVDVYNTVISMIRSVETNGAHLILLEGTAYSGMHSWTSSGNAAAFAEGNITDASNNYAINVHQYFDPQYTGATDDACVSTSTISGIVTPFVAWLNTNNYRAFVTETGGCSIQTSCVTAVNYFLGLLEDNASASPTTNTSPGFIGWTGWAGGGINPNVEDKMSLSPTYVNVDSDPTAQSATMTGGFVPNLTAPQ